jgi:hypothetical protein
MSFLALLFVLAHIQEAQHDAPALLWGVAGWSLVVLLSATSARGLSPLLVVALSVATVPVLLPASRLENPETEILGQRLLHDAQPTTIVLTNVAELPLWLERNGGADIDVRHVLAADQRYEIDTLTNDAVGQRARVHALMRAHWYGPVVFSEEIDGLLVPSTWLALRDDARTGHLIDVQAIADRTQRTDLGSGLFILRVVSE